MKRKLTLFLLSIFTFLLSQAQSPLEKTVNIAAGTYELIDILNELNRQKANLAFSSDILPSYSLSLSQKQTTVGGVLKLLQEKTGIRYQVSNELIILSYQLQMFTLSGTIRDNQTGEVLIGANIIINGGVSGTVTNSYGFYSITLPQGIYKVEFRYLGFGSSQENLSLSRNIEKVVNLEPESEVLNELVVSSISPDFNVINNVPGISQINFGEQWPIPYFLGEEDIFQNSLLMPGIRSIGEDATGLNIRGGDIDQNLILLDEAPIYNPNHFYGLISVFSPEVVNNVDVMKGYIPPQYGGRASSVINIVQKEGNNKEFHVSGGMGLVSSRLTAEGPIKIDKASFLFSARQSLLNFNIEDFINQSLDDSRTSFRDFNTKINWNINNRNKLYLSGYLGQDRNRAGFDAVRKWGNRSVSVRWNHLFSPRLFSNFTGVLSEYTYQISDPQEVGSFIGKSNIVNYSFKGDFGYQISPAHSLDFGIQGTFHKLKPGERIPFNQNSSSDSTFLDTEHALETSLYLSHAVEISSNLKMQYGMRLSTLQNFGKEDVYVYERDRPKTDESILDTLSYKSGQIFNRETSWEPRISLNYNFDGQNSIKASYTKTNQYIHLISNTVSPSPTDIWKLTDRYIRPTRADHYSLGYYKNFRSNKWESHMEVYYKDIENVIDFRDGADLLFNENVETELLNGSGTSFGLEFYLKRKTGPLRGWLSYTLSKTEQKFSSEYSELTINDGRSFPTGYDKTHDISAVGIWSTNNRVSLSASFNYTTGRPITLPVGKFIFDGKVVPDFEDRNQDRLPSYHRLDLSLKLTGRKHRKDGSLRKNRDYWIFALYNVYARKNVYSYFFRESVEQQGTTEAIPYSIFGTIIPAVTYNFRF